MSANTNILYLSKEEEENSKVKKLDDASKEFAIEVASAEKLKGLVSNMHIFDKYKEPFQPYVIHLNNTMNCWTELKRKLIVSGNRLRSFCTTYGHYYTGLQEYLKHDTHPNKNKILQYLNEINGDVKKATEAINRTKIETNTYVNHLSEDKENLQKKVTPKLKEIYDQEKLVLDSLQKDITNSENKLAELEKKYLIAVFGSAAGGTMAATGIGLTIYISKVNNVAVKTTKLITDTAGTAVTSRLGLKILGIGKEGLKTINMLAKGLAVITIITTIVGISGITAGIYYIVNLSKAISEENTKLTNFKLRQTQLQPEVMHLESLRGVFTKITEQTENTHKLFSKLEENWGDIANRFELMKEKLKSVNEEFLAETLKDHLSLLDTMNKEFENFSKNLANHGLGLNLTAQEDIQFVGDEHSSDTHTIFTPRIKIPPRLYSSYNSQYTFN